MKTSWGIEAFERAGAGLLYFFEDFSLDADRHELRRGAAQVAVEPQVFDLLLFLVQNRDRIVSKDDLLASVWGGRIVSESTLDSRINAARRAIGDSGREQRLIRTTIGKGIRFIGGLRDAPEPALEPSLPAEIGGPKRASQHGSGRGVVALTVAFLILVTAAGVWWARSTVAPPQAATTAAGGFTPAAPRMSIVVLPFANLSGDAGQEYFADAITDGLTADLSRISNSFVIARTTAFTYKDKPVDVKRIGRELRVRYVLEGSVRRVGDDVDVTVQLIDAENGGHVWSDRIDTSRAHLGKAQDEIIARLARALRLELLAAIDRRIEQDGPVNLDAQDLAMRGWAIYMRPQTAASLHEAERLFEQALAADPDSVDARIGIAAMLGQLLGTGMSTDQPHDMALCDQMLREALDRDRNAPQAHAELGRLRRLQGRLAESQLELATALSLDRNNSLAIIQSGITELFLGKPQEALPFFEKFQLINPQYQNLYFVYYWLGESHILLDRADKAIPYLKEGRTANPKMPWMHLQLAAALGLSGNFDEARESLAEFVKLKPELSSFSKLRAFEDTLLFEHGPQFIALREKTIYVGLRAAGLPDE